MMKTWELIEVLKKLDPNLDVCHMHDIGPMLVSDAYVLEGPYEDPANKKLIRREVEGRFICFGAPADYDVSDHRKYKQIYDE